MSKPLSEKVRYIIERTGVSDHSQANVIDLIDLKQALKRLQDLVQIEPFATKFKEDLKEIFGEELLE